MNSLESDVHKYLNKLNSLNDKKKVTDNDTGPLNFHKIVGFFVCVLFRRVTIAQTGFAYSQLFMVSHKPKVKTIQIVSSKHINIFTLQLFIESV